MDKEYACNAEDASDIGSIPGSLGRFPGEGHGNPLQYSCLENPVDRGDSGASLWGCKKLDMTEASEHSAAHVLCKTPY